MNLIVLLSILAKFVIDFNTKFYRLEIIVKVLPNIVAPIFIIGLLSLNLVNLTVLLYLLFRKVLKKFL